MRERLLTAYLNDELAAGVLRRDAARRALRNDSAGELDPLATRHAEPDLDALVERVRRQRDEIEPPRRGLCDRP